MFELVPLKEWHLALLAEEKDHSYMKKWFSSGLSKRLEESNACVSFMKDATPLVCGGINQYWSGRGELWTVFSSRSKDCFVPTFRAIRRWIHDDVIKKYRRVEMAIELDAHIAKRRAELLGFKVETPLAKSYLPNGKAVSIYTLTRDENVC